MIRLESAALTLAVALSSLGCADNAILDVDLVLPMATAEARVAVLDVRPASGFDFEGGIWQESDVYPPLETELGASTTTVVGSVPAEHIEQDVLVRVRFCGEEACAASAPAVCFRLERPFHAGEVSTFHAEITSIPPSTPSGSVCAISPTTITRCEIGCAGVGPTMGADYCRADGSHTCDR